SSKIDKMLHINEQVVELVRMNDIKLFNRYDILKNYNNITSPDEKFKFTKVCDKKIVFPYTPNYDLLKIDKKSLYYISTYKIANSITRIVATMVKNIGLNANKITVTDCCAGVGGNTISFAKHFKHVN